MEWQSTRQFWAELGARVKARDPLVSLDSAREELAAGEQAARVAGLEAQAPLLDRQIHAIQRQLEREDESSRRAADEARALAPASTSEAGMATIEAGRVEELERTGAASELSRRRARADAERQGSLADAAAQAVRRLEQRKQCMDGRLTAMGAPHRLGSDDDRRPVVRGGQPNEQSVTTPHPLYPEPVAACARTRAPTHHRHAPTRPVG